MLKSCVREDDVRVDNEEGVVEINADDVLEVDADIDGHVVRERILS